MYGFLNIKMLLILTAFLLTFTACPFGSQWHQPNTPATSTIVVGVKNCNDSEVENPLQTIQNKLTEKLEAAHVSYQNITANTEKQELTFNIIGHEDPTNKTDFGAILLSEADLRLITAVRATDDGVASWLDTIITKENLSPFFDKNIAMGMNYGQFNLAVLGACNKEGQDQIQRAFQKYERKLPFKIYWGENKSIIEVEGGEPVPDLFMYATKKKNKNVVTINNVVNASAAPSLYTGQLEILFTMDPKGAKAFAEMTSAAANDGNREILILINEEVVAAPRVNEAITGGKASISGNYEDAEAELMVTLLNMGMLSCELELRDSGVNK